MLFVGIFFGTFEQWQGEAAIQEKHHSLNRDGTEKIAIIRVEGTLLSADGYIKKQIDRVREDTNVKAIVLRIDSPGGTITASDLIYHKMRELADDRKLPIVVSMGGLAASGGYYVAMAVGDTPEVIFAEPTTWTGSIGVIIPHYNFAGLLEDWKIEEDSVMSHPLKSMGSLARDMTEREREIFQALVDDSFGRFKEVVRNGRPQFRGQEGEARLEELTTGQIFTANQALEHGLVDEIGYLDAAIAKAVELADLAPEQTQAVEYAEPITLSNLLWASVDSKPQLNLGNFFELATPRGYYLFTWPGGVITSGTSISPGL